MAGTRRWFLLFLRGTILVCLVGMMPMHQAAAAGESRETRHVLVLYSFRTILPTQVEIDQGLRAALKSGSRHPVDIDMEYLDMGRFEEAAYLDELMNLLRRKYAHRRLDVIIPVFDPAVKFLRKYGDTIFPGVPVVFAAEFQQFLQNLILKPHMTGAYVEPALAANLHLALRLHPQTRRVVVVGGTSGADRVFLSWAQEAFAPHLGQVEFTYLTDLSLEELQNHVAHLPPHTIIFYVTIFQDGKGQEFLPRDALKLVAKGANAPWGLGHLIGRGHRGRVPDKSPGTRPAGRGTGGPSPQWGKT